MNSIETIDAKLFLISKRIEEHSLDLINPTNSITEKDNFFASYKKYTQYNPKFNYLEKIDFENEQRELELIKTNLKNSLAEQIISNRVNSLLKEIQLLNTVNTKKFCNSSKNVYGEPNNSEVKLALETLSEKIKESKNTLNAEQMRKELQKHLTNTGFEAKLKSNMSAKASVNLTKKKLYLNSNSNFKKNDAIRLKAHEIETHIYRHLNGLNQPLKILSKGYGEEYLKTEEGLAIFNEEQNKASSIEQNKIIAARLYAVRYALTHDFFDTFEEMKKYFSEEEAYTLTQRVKRGILINEKGSFTKDYCYYSGLIKIKEYYQSGRSLKSLYYGKISLGEIKIVNKIKGIKEPNYLPNYMSKN